MNFSDFALNPFILASIAKAGYTTPTPVQEQAIPAALQGADLLVSSHTGSGKTAAFLLPALERLHASPPISKGRGPRVLILTPTRELALQVQAAAELYGGGFRRLRTACLVGGSSYNQQLRQLSQPVDIVVATPGRLLDHLHRGRIDFGRIEILVLDEADRMLDMGFIDDIEEIVSHTPQKRQTLLFSATLDGVVGSLAKRLTTNPKRIAVPTPAVAEQLIDQKLLFTDDMAHKENLLTAILQDNTVEQALVFTSTKRSAEELSLTLQTAGFSAAALHGDMNQGQRNRALQRLRDGRVRVLVATDVAARGIDVLSITHVINFDMPKQAEDYVHRIGRTGRAGRQGIAMTFASYREREMVRTIEKYTGKPIRVHVIAGLEPRLTPASPARSHYKRQGRSFGSNGVTRRNDWGDGVAYGNVPAKRSNNTQKDRRYNERPARETAFERMEGTENMWDNRVKKRHAVSSDPSKWGAMNSYKLTKQESVSATSHRKKGVKNTHKDGFWGAGMDGMKAPKRKTTSVWMADWDSERQSFPKSRRDRH